MPDENPYATPQSSLAPQLGENEPILGAWRKGNYLVMRRGATLPPYCVVTGEPISEDPARIGFLGPGTRWFPAELYFTYDYVYLPLSASPRWRCEIVTAALLATLTTVFASEGVMVGTLNPEWDFLGFAGLITLGGIVLALCVLGMTLARYRVPLTLYDTTSDHLWLTGVAPSFLDRLPELPDETGPT